MFDECLFSEEFSYICDTYKHPQSEQGSGLYKDFLCTVQLQKNRIFNSVLKLRLQNYVVNFLKYRYSTSFENILLFHIVN